MKQDSLSFRFMCYRRREGFTRPKRYARRAELRKQSGSAITRQLTRLGSPAESAPLRKASASRLMAILELIAAKPEAALDKAKAMIPQLRASNRPIKFQKLVIQFVETVILYQFPKWSREKIEEMLQVSDVRQTRVFQEAKEEAVEKVPLAFLKLAISVEKIVTATGLTPAQIRKLGKKCQDA